MELDTGPRPTGSAAAFDELYRQGRAPWDVGHPQPAVFDLLESGAIRPPVLDAGCGNGENALLVASRGFEVVGIDFAPTAIGQARERAAGRGLPARFVVGDALALDRLERRFLTIIDSGLFHTFDPDLQARYVASLRAVLEPGGVLHLLCFSEFEPDWGGPRRITRAELRSAFAEGWRVESIDPALFETNLGTGAARAWRARIVRLADGGAGSG